MYFVFSKHTKNFLKCTHTFRDQLNRAKYDRTNKHLCSHLAMALVMLRQLENELPNFTFIVVITQQSCDFEGVGTQFLLTTFWYVH